MCYYTKKSKSIEYKIKEVLMLRLVEKIPMTFVAKLTHILILLLEFTALVTLVFLPPIVKTVLRYEIGSGYAMLGPEHPLYMYFLVLLYISGILAFLVLDELRKIFKSCILEDVFIHKNVSRLLRLAILTFVISLVFFSKVFVVNSVMTVVIVFVFFMASVFCLVLTLLFNQAIQIKEENDLTI